MAVPRVRFPVQPLDKKAHTSQQVGTILNWKTLTGLAAIVGLIAAFTACNGVTFADRVKVDVPQQIQESTGEPQQVPLSKAPFVRQRYVDDVKTNLAQFDQEIEDAQLFSDFVGSLLNTGLTLAEGPLQGVPLGGAIFAALGGLTGLFIRKPGTQKEVDAAWDESARRTREALLEGIQVAKSPASP